MTIREGMGQRRTSDADEQRRKAERFRALHREGRLLVLPNVWNPLGARLLASLGYPAVATASAAVAYSLGYDDGEQIAFEEMLSVVGRIARSVSVPVSADIERGYAADAKGVRSNVHRVLAAGVVGINIEDSFEEGGALREVNEQCERIRACREAGDEAAIPLVINARIDVFMQAGDMPLSERLEEAIARGKAYLDAGADCLYPILLADLTALKALHAATGSPLNVYASASAASMYDLESAGIARLSIGPGMLRAAVTAMRDVALELKAYGGYDRFTRNAITSDEIRAFLMDSASRPRED